MPTMPRNAMKYNGPLKTSAVNPNVPNNPQLKKSGGQIPRDPSEFGGPSLLNLPDSTLVQVLRNSAFADLVSLVAPSSSQKAIDCRGMVDTGRLARLIELTEAAIVTRMWKFAAARNVSGKVDVETIKQMVLAMARFSANSTVCVAGCAALEASGVLGQPDAAQILLECNGGAFLVNQMRAHIEDPAVQEYGTWILGSLGYLGFAQPLNLVGAVDVVVLALKKHPGNYKIIRNGARALEGLSQGAEDVLHDGRCRSLLHIMRDHSEDSEAVRLACSALATILREAGEQQQDCVESTELVAAATACMSCHCKDPKVLTEHTHTHTQQLNFSRNK